MCKITRRSLAAGFLCLVIGAFAYQRVTACGGFFCQLIPINQAGEQIIFRQDGNMVTAVVLIQYAGNASDFSWVVPVPGIPELSTGSDLIFSPLELATRPQFTLETVGEPCADLFRGGISTASPTSDSAGEDDGGVEILEAISVGPFEALVISSDDPEALATWLADNDYDLSDRGLELIAPYVEEGMNFVALRLRQDQGVGDIQPLIMRYVSDEPTIPIRLTAVAAEPDMGVIVWLLGDSRAVPLNYLHVTPNYTTLNWYAGSTNAYVSYQGLITAAMNEAGGQGFATDYAGRDLDVVAQLPSVTTLEDELVRLSAIAGDADMISTTVGGFVFQSDKVLEILRRQLPLPEGQDEFVYQVAALLTELFTTAELAAARSGLVVELNDSVIDPLIETVAVFDGDPYVTRLFTTLSPEEMTLDPRFSFNPDLGDQAIERVATLSAACSAFGTSWSLTLGAGTGRDGEVVIQGTGLPPSFNVPVIDQDSVWRTEMVGVSGPPTVVTQKQFAVAQVIGEGGQGALSMCGLGTAECGAGTGVAMLMMMLGLRATRTARSGRRVARKKGLQRKHDSAP